MPTVSIITPCYNSAEFIGRTIESVRAQTFADWEHVVVDDGSADDSAAAVEKYLASDPRLRLVRQPNGGVCRARNAGFAAASPCSKYLLFLDADDLLVPEMLQELVEYLEARPHVAMAFCGYNGIGAGGEEVAAGEIRRLVPTALGLRELPPRHAPTPFASLFAGALALPSFALLRRSAYEEVGEWDEWLGQHHEDLDLFCRLALRGEVHYLDRRLGFYRRHEGQSSQEAKADQARAQRLNEQARKLNQKWRDVAHLPPAQQSVVRAARRFVQRRVVPHARAQAAAHLLRRGQLYPAARLCVGALLRYMGWVE